MVEKFRMDLHQIPEIGFNEFETQKYILEVLKDLKCEITKINTGVAAYFNANKPTTIALRADMDALPIEEKNDITYKSSNKGMMHACGHDGHMAMLLETCLYINENLDKINNNVLAIFQPSEEIAGGSNSIIKTRIIDKYNCKAIFGFHLWPNLEYGKILSREKELMAKSGELNIKIIGKSVHAASANLGIDALKIGVMYLNDLYEMESKMDKDVFRLLKFGKMSSGSIRNIISDHTIIEGTMRAFSNEVFSYMKEKIYEIASRYIDKYSCQIEINIVEGYQPVVNNSEIYNLIKEELKIIELEKPVMQAEDFGNYLSEYKGVFMFIGLGEVNALHTSNFNFDMNVLNVGVEAYKKLINMNY